MKKFLLVILCNAAFYYSGYSQIHERDINLISLDSLLNVPISSASRYRQKSFEAPSAVSIISYEEIEKFGYQTLGEVLSSLGGFYLSYDRNYSYLGVRGFSRPTDYNNRILLLVNNHPVNEVIFGSSPMGTELGISMSAVDRIEIVRGPGSSLYGTGAMFSVVNLVTKRGKDFDRASLSIGGNSLEGFSGTLNYGTEFQNGLEVFLTTEYFDQRGNNIYFKEFDNISTNNGIAAGLDKDNYFGMLATINYKQLQFQGKFSIREKYIPTASYETNFNDNRTKNKDAISFSEITYTIPLNSDDKITFSNSINFYNYEGSYAYENFVLRETADAAWTIFNAQLDWAWSSSNHLIAGVEYKGNLLARYKEMDDDGDLFNKNVLYSIRSAYLHDEFQPMPNLLLTASLRYDNNTLCDGLFSPRGAVVYNLGQSTTFKLIYGTSYRSPNIYELFYEDEETNFKPNPSLFYEKIRTLEFVAEHKALDNLYAALSIYKYKVNDLIDQEYEEADSSLQFINYGNVSTVGFETDINYYPLKDTRAFFRYSYHDASYYEEKSNLSNSPKHLVRTGVVFPILNSIYCAPELFYESGRYTVYNTRTENFLLANLTLTTKTLFDRFKFSLSVKNLFNTTYEHPGGFEHVQPAIVQNARNFFLRFQMDF
ncbi:MAG: TonB-dependent receptor [Ignavibacteriales bacterium]|nr:TonB-dependent receptor [Ignavibacteriales bacterium]